MSDFMKEDRYIVIKRSDLMEALACENNSMEPADVNTLVDVCALLEDRRENLNLPPREYVVVESDWRCYSRVWDMVKDEHIQNQTYVYFSYDETTAMINDQSYKKLLGSTHRRNVITNEVFEL